MVHSSLPFIPSLEFFNIVDKHRIFLHNISQHWDCCQLSLDNRYSSWILEWSSTLKTISSWKGKHCSLKWSESCSPSGRPISMDWLIFHHLRMISLKPCSAHLMSPVIHQVAHSLQSCPEKSRLCTFFLPLFPLWYSDVAIVLLQKRVVCPNQK